MLLVERADGLVLVQDHGRPDGWRCGVGVSGAFDRRSHDAAQRLVGNQPDAAGLELTMAHVELVSTISTALVCTGAGCEVRLDGRVVQFGAPLAVPAGAQVSIHRPTTGARVYVAVSGGLDLPAVLASRSTDTMAIIGPSPVQRGDELPVGAVHTRAAWHGVSLPAASDTTLQAAAGPHAALLNEPVVRAMVSATSSRAGVRLDTDLRPAPHTGELPSFPVIPGAVQLTPSGELIVLGPDAGITGGYPVVAVVDRNGLDRLAQSRPGESLTLAISRPRSAR
jgi:biotin-dependent carboxylase-like uncharacterized protein